MYRILLLALLLLGCVAGLGSGLGAQSDAGLGAQSADGAGAGGGGVAEAFTDVSVVLAEAARALDQRRYDDAAERYRAALRLASPLPEAEYGLALVFHADGLGAAAERQYLRALTQRAHLRLPELEYEIRYRLAGLYFERDELFKYEAQLNMIVARDTQFVQRGLRVNARRVLYDRGIDRLFALYRFDNFFALAAHARLGEHFVRSGNYGQAVDHLMFALILRGQQLVGISQQHVLDAQRQNYSDLLINAHRVAPILNQLRQGYDIYRLMFYLGAALYGDNPQHSRWRATLTLLSELDSASPWLIRARERLASPALETLYY